METPIKVVKVQFHLITLDKFTKNNQAVKTTEQLSNYSADDTNLDMKIIIVRLN